MSYFSRLTDIVTCNLSEILEQEADPKAAIDRILFEIQEGVSGAERSLITARKNADGIEQEIRQHQTQADHWGRQARAAVQRDEESEARRALLRKSELLDLVAGLEQQLESARNLVAHLTTTHRAIEARLSDAFRKRRELLGDDAPALESTTMAERPTMEINRCREIENELDALKRELGQK